MFLFQREPGSQGKGVWAWAADTSPALETPEAHTGHVTITRPHPPMGGRAEDRSHSAHFCLITPLRQLVPWTRAPSRPQTPLTYSHSPP